jgi:hypothetical protein
MADEGWGEKEEKGGRKNEMREVADRSTKPPEQRKQ